MIKLLTAQFSAFLRRRHMVGYFGRGPSRTGSLAQGKLGRFPTSLCGNARAALMPIKPLLNDKLHFGLRNICAFKDEVDGAPQLEMMDLHGFEQPPDNPSS